jgi:hypothetical protein
MFSRCLSAVLFVLLARSAWAATPDPGEASRVDIGHRFSVEAPVGDGWQKTAEPATYLRELEPKGHSLVLVAVTGPSGITSKEVRSLLGPAGGDRLVRLIGRFFQSSFQASAAGLEQGRFEKIDIVNAVMGKHNVGEFVCAYSRIRALDRGATAEGVPMQIRYVVYSCLDLGYLEFAAQVSYSERGREQDLSDDVMAEGERFARSLQRTRP